MDPDAVTIRRDTLAGWLNSGSRGELTRAVVSGLADLGVPVPDELNRHDGRLLIILGGPEPGIVLRWTEGNQAWGQRLPIEAAGRNYRSARRFGPKLSTEDLLVGRLRVAASPPARGPGATRPPLAVGGNAVPPTGNPLVDFLLRRAQDVLLAVPVAQRFVDAVMHFVEHQSARADIRSGATAAGSAPVVPETMPDDPLRGVRFPDLSSVVTQRIADLINNPRHPDPTLSFARLLVSLASKGAGRDRENRCDVHRAMLQCHAEMKVLLSRPQGWPGEYGAILQQDLATLNSWCLNACDNYSAAIASLDEGTAEANVAKAITAVHGSPGVRGNQLA